ncbi:hypothetical protein J1605_011700 [Eschrichtius robustus]|uniref:Uncharacterized protein n=1 Tax=Eschrichtius robustus TaxID=9764 RepID=A0AB34GLG6_ESCRO|nr:hypothetical protein J1605_011700 [Eschrichtius robustus]
MAISVESIDDKEGEGEAADVHNDEGDLVHVDDEEDEGEREDEDGDDVEEEERLKRKMTKRILMDSNVPFI